METTTITTTNTRVNKTLTSSKKCPPEIWLVRLPERVAYCPI
jgi:hypothetical protein